MKGFAAAILIGKFQYSLQKYSCLKFCMWDMLLFYESQCRSMWRNLTDLTVSAESQRPVCGVQALAPRIRLPSSLRNIDLEVAGVSNQSYRDTTEIGGRVGGWGDRFSIAVFLGRAKRATHLLK